MKIRMLCVTRYSTKVLNILLQKADKRALDNLISRSKFDQSIGGLEQSMQELLHRLDGQVGSTRHKFLYHLRFNLFFDSPFIVSSSLLISENLDMVWKYHQTNLKKILKPQDIAVYYWGTLEYFHYWVSYILQESSLSDALARLAGDIDQKLDRLELDPLKDYFGNKWLPRAVTEYFTCSQLKCFIPPLFS